MNRGEVWWVEDPEAGRRPHLVLTRQLAIAVLNSIVAVPATTAIRGIPTEVFLGREDGMPRECALRLDGLTTLPKDFFVDRICQLSPARLHQVCAALAVATDCR